MKVQLISDLHLDVNPMQPPCGGSADLCLIAGDLHEVDQGVALIEAVLQARPVVYVLGNHECYTSSLRVVREKFLQHARRLPNFHFLDRRTAVFEGVRIIGATLWTDFNRQAPLSMMQARGMVKDYEHIHHDHENRLVLPADILNEHLLDLAFIESELAKPWAGNTVVLTHHAPSEDSCSGRYANQYNNFLFASRLERLFYDYPIHTWAHGHIHQPVDYQINSSRVLSNPRGTQPAECAAYNPYFEFVC
jgi:predicted phosphodiesterase